MNTSDEMVGSISMKNTSRRIVTTVKREFRRGQCFAGSPSWAAFVISRSWAWPVSHREDGEGFTELNYAYETSAEKPVTFHDVAELAAEKIFLQLPKAEDE
jgi:hypothetical protein